MADKKPAARKRSKVETPKEYEPKPGEQQYIGQGTPASTAPKVIQPLIDLAKRHETTKAALKKLKEKKSTEDAEGLILFGKYEKYFTEDDKGNMIYEYDGGQIIILKKGIQFETRSKPTVSSVKAAAANA